MRRGLTALERASLAAVFAAGIGFSAPAFAQTTGLLEGTIRDQAGSPLPGVNVTVSSPRLQGTRTIVAGANGVFRFPAVPPGEYAVHVTCRVSRAGEDGDRGARRNRHRRLHARTGGRGRRRRDGHRSDRRYDVHDDRDQLHEQGDYAPARRPQLRRHRPIESGRRPGSRRYARPLARADRLRRHLGREPVDHRRRQHDQRPQGLAGQGDQQRVRPGGRDQDRQLPGRVRPSARRRHQRHHEVRRQRFPRRRLLLLRLRPHPGEPDLHPQDRPSRGCAWIPTSARTTAPTSAATCSGIASGSSLPTTAST